jgi:hypothetical protein
MEFLDSKRAPDRAFGFENFLAESIPIPILPILAEKTPYAIALPSRGGTRPPASLAI